MGGTAILKTFYVDLAEKKYPIVVGKGLLSDAGILLSGAGFKSAPIVISNARVWRLHGDVLAKSLKRVFGPGTLIRIGDGEQFKNHATLMKIYEGMFHAHADRRSWILAFGGGVVGDIAGFAAATFMRGIPYAMAPTTLLSQVDSSIGGKVGINVKEGKNLIGAFHQPTAVLTDIGVLRTLPKRELRSGLYEVIKSSAIGSMPLVGYLERKLPEILSCRPQAMEQIVVSTAKIKAGIVTSDEKEGGVRMILNYGHTVGHAFETATDYRRFKHGEAVGWGMIAALEYGRELGMLLPEESARLIRLIHRVGRLPSLKGISVDDLWDSLVRDKKFRSGDIRMVLLRQLGDAETRGGIVADSLRQFLRRFLAEKSHAEVHSRPASGFGKSSSMQIAASNL
jgi:3-dehydroquinate synthase